MASKWADYRVFLGEFRRNFHSTGAILPSGRSLGRALSRFVRDGDEVQNATQNGSSTGRKILEVGPGTGSFADSLLDFLKNYNLEMYRNCEYTFVEISPELAGECEALM